MIDKSKISGREYVFSTYVKSQTDYENDLLVVKERLHLKDGTTENNLRCIENYQRDYYITKKEFQDHEQKKEYEHRGKLDKFTCNQVKLPKAIQGRLKGFAPRGYVGLSDANESPYVYGSDIRTPVLLANDYKTRYPNTFSDTTLAVLDFETDVLHGTGMIISGSLTYKDKVHLVFTKDFLDTAAEDPQVVIDDAFKKHLNKEYITRRNITIKVNVVKRASEVVQALMATAHKWSPDVVGIWNIAFDVPKMIKALEVDNIDPANVFSDPAIPRRYRYFNWRLAPKVKITADGKKSIKHIADLWHTVTTPASFYFIDLMCLFKRTRGREQLRNSYALDNILATEVDLGKLRFEETAHLTKLDWHIAMQRSYKVEYLIYNIFDCVSCEILDEQTKDVAKSLRVTIGLSELSKIGSNPKRLQDDMHFDLMSKNKVIGSTSGDMTSELDKLTPSLKGWIVTLASELEYGIGRNLIAEYPTLETNITTYAADEDLESAYPSGEDLMNVSMSTRAFETCTMDGLTTIEQRSIGINLSSVDVNAIEIARLSHGLPPMVELLERYKAQR